MRRLCYLLTQGSHGHTVISIFLYGECFEHRKILRIPDIDWSFHRKYFPSENYIFFSSSFDWGFGLFQFKCVVITNSLVHYDIIFFFTLLIPSLVGTLFVDAIVLFTSFSFCQLQRNTEQNVMNFFAPFSSTRTWKSFCFWYNKQSRKMTLI